MCISCGGTKKPDITEYIQKQDNFIAVIKNVPCLKCTQCGETYFEGKTVEKLESILDGIKVIASEITVSVIDYHNNVA